MVPLPLCLDLLVVCLRGRNLQPRSIVAPWAIITRFSLGLVLLVCGATHAAADTIVVPAGGSLQAALNSSHCGDTIVVAAGASFITSADQGFIFPAKNGAQCVGTAADTITVMSSNVTSLPAAGGRVSLADAANMPKLVTTGPTPAMGFDPNSRFWKLIGIEITTTPNPQVYTQFLAFIGTDIPFTQVPSDITFDRCYIHSQEDGTNNPHATARAGVDVHAARVTFQGCRLALPGGYAGASQTVDNTYTILMGKGPGPLTIDNCFINSWYTGFFLGGSSLDTTNTGTVAAGATLGQATISNVNNLNVGDLIAFKNQNSFYEVARVTALAGNAVSFISVGREYWPRQSAYLCSDRGRPGPLEWSQSDQHQDYSQHVLDKPRHLCSNRKRGFSIPQRLVRG